jgi:putative pyruvate formate lyase activating enzyme
MKPAISFLEIPNFYLCMMQNDIHNRLEHLNIQKLEEQLRVLQNCRICPRNCGADRFSSKPGYCKSDASYYISSICIHKGEEPAISGIHGICNIFFGHCNLQCLYCQNHQISFNKNKLAANHLSLKQVLKEVVRCLEDGCEGVGFVSPSHFVPQVKVIINALHELGLHPTIVYNTNGYDTVETLKEIEPLVDVYLPDFKYIDPKLSKKYSDVKDYPEIAKKALCEIYRQKGSTLLTKENGLAERGIIIRHLVLPGHIENSFGVLRFIAEEISTSIHISVMSQYYPTKFVKQFSPLNRTLYVEEYQKVVCEFHRLGFRKGWIQDLESHENYQPDFDKEHPFEN